MIEENTDAAHPYKIDMMIPTSSLNKNRQNAAQNVIQM